MIENLHSLCLLFQTVLVAGLVQLAGASTCNKYKKIKNISKEVRHARVRESVSIKVLPIKRGAP